MLKLAGAMGMLKMGTVALDGTKVHANASRHSALSYGHAKKIEKQLKREVKQLLRLAEQADGVNTPDGMSIPEELERRESRLAAIAEAKAKIEARAEGASGTRASRASKQTRRARRTREAHRQEAAWPAARTAHRRGERQGPGESDGRRLAHHESRRRRLRSVLQRPGSGGHRQHADRGHAK